jgi:hypothetical protein
MSDRFVPVGLVSFAVRPRAVYRFYATVRADGAVLPMAEVWRALTLSGFAPDLQLWPSGQPSDWPTEDAPPLRSGQRIVRGQGTFCSDRLSTVVHLPSGLTLQIWNVWEHQDAATGEESGFGGALGSAAPLGLLLLGLVGLAMSSPSRKRKRGP